MTDTTEASISQTGIAVFSRDEFASRRFHYEKGQHAVFTGPTQRGKTSLAFKLLEYTASPEMPVYVAVCKPADKVTTKEGNRLGYRRVAEWPPPPRVRDLMSEKPAGYLVWPHLGNMTTDVDHASKVTADLIDDVYSKGRRGKPGILMLDDTVIKSKVMGLDKHMTTVLTMSGAMGVGGWFFVQKPTDAGKTALWSYSQSEHIFLCKDPDRRNRERYGEIGGFNTREIDEISRNLKPYQFLYLERTHGYRCIVDSK